MSVGLRKFMQIYFSLVFLIHGKWAFNAMLCYDIYLRVSNLMESLAEVDVFLQSKLANGGDISCTNSLEKFSSKMLPWLMHSLLLLLPLLRLKCSQCTTRRDSPDALWKLNGTPVRQFGSDLVLAS